MPHVYVVPGGAKRREGDPGAPPCVSLDLLRRVEQHKALAVPGFTRKYRVTLLVYAERYCDIHEAIAREKQLKGWNRSWKLKLIEASNPNWLDLDPTAC
jgi:putative endonuclease